MLFLYLIRLRNFFVSGNNLFFSYKDVGVDIDVGNVFVEWIKGVVKCICCFEVMGGLGGFGVLCELLIKYKYFVLVFGIDGVGIKLCFVLDMKKYDIIGIDLVVMCVNDLIV